MQTITIDIAISYVSYLFSNNPDFSKLTYYMYYLPENDKTTYLFLEDISGDWDISYKY